MSTTFSPWRSNLGASASWFDWGFNCNATAVFPKNYKKSLWSVHGQTLKLGCYINSKSEPNSICQYFVGVKRTSNWCRYFPRYFPSTSSPPQTHQNSTQYTHIHSQTRFSSSAQSQAKYFYSFTTKQTRAPGKLQQMEYEWKKKRSKEKERKKRKERKNDREKQQPHMHSTYTRLVWHYAV